SLPLFHRKLGNEVDQDIGVRSQNSRLPRADEPSQIRCAAASIWVVRQKLCHQAADGSAARRWLAQEIPHGLHAIGIFPTARDYHQSCSRGDYNLTANIGEAPQLRLRCCPSVKSRRVKTGLPVELLNR